MSKIKTYWFLLFILGSIFTTQAQQDRKHIRQGNRAYEKAIIDSVTIDSTMYIKAQADYEKALEKNPNNWDALYNKANSIYRQQNYDDAIKQFQAIAGMEQDDKDKKAMAYHNLGNCLLQKQELENAIEAYKNALRNNPDDLDTKYNLAWAQNKLQEQPQDDQQNEGGGDNQEQDQDKDQDQDEGENEDQNQNQDQQNQDEGQNQEQQRPDQISEEDAMRILEALQNDEKDVQEKVQKQKGQPVKVKTEKDW